MIIEFYVTKEDLLKVLTNLKENFIQINQIVLNDNGNYELTVLTDTKHQALIILTLYFG